MLVSNVSKCLIITGKADLGECDLASVGDHSQCGYDLLLDVPFLLLLTVNWWI